jgi:hypothetical protein
MDFRNHPLTAESSFGERGSAISEFVLIATPLFLPALLFFNAMNNTAKEEMNTSMLARQAVRAFVTAPDLMTGHQRVKVILDQYAELEGARGFGGTSGTSGTSGSGNLGGLENSGRLTSPTRYEFTYNIKCYAEKCLEPGSLVELELYRKIESIDKIESSKDRKASAVARSYVDKWRDTP